MLEKIFEEIKASQTIIIHRHVRPDPDAFGSQGGLATLIKDNFPEKKVWLTGEKSESLDFLLTMDTVADEIYQDALVIVCDTANRERIDDQRFTQGRKLIKIDHHPVVDSYGDLEWVDPSSSSTSEMIARFCRSQPQLKLTPQAARLLFAGIVGDTGRFQYSNVTPETFETAAELVRQPFDRQDFFNHLYRNNVNVLHLNGYVLQNFTLTPEGVGFIKLSLDTIRHFHLQSSDASSLVNCFSSAENLKAWVLFSEEEGLIRARIRSKGPEIHLLAANYHGGGHPMASGATVYNWEEADQLIADLRALVRHDDEATETPGSLES
ncbi:DHH family phosphoesterase [Sporolactobacillus spathodeae]|uniref:Phosphoesterase RecJ-like protein n=1 Tax=Sporolactobacillus spathodeae TaxID=1465502 RepID=A0ABS2QBB6_9BACL|nr:phosphoesterase RecJ-like protein [Sporolactobacillus spathodeae]